jgi:hypothetical protein
MASALLFVEFNGIICYYNRKKWAKFSMAKRGYQVIYADILGIPRIGGI